VPHGRRRDGAERGREDEVIGKTADDVDHERSAARSARPPRALFRSPEKRSSARSPRRVTSWIASATSRVGLYALEKERPPTHLALSDSVEGRSN
jgi:hypothetical protein